MDPKTIIEAVGYLGSVMVLVSCLMASVVRLRIINAIGSAIFAVYALLIHSYPTALMNVCLVLINIYYLRKLRNTKTDFTLAALSPEESFVRYFLSEYAADIARCFPGRALELGAVDRAYLVSHGGTPAGLLLGKETDGVLTIALDYSTPAFRDSSEGRFLLERLPAEGLRALRYENAEEGHLAYLKKMGYSQRDGAWVRAL